MSKYKYNHICTYTYHLFAKSPGNVGCMQLKTHKKEHVFFKAPAWGCSALVFSKALKVGTISLSAARLLGVSLPD